MSTIHGATAPSGGEAARDSDRLAGRLFLAGSALAIVKGCAQLPWGFVPHWTSVADALVQAALGAWLLRLNRNVTPFALTFILVASAYPLVRTAFSLVSGHPAVLAGPLVVLVVLAGPLVIGMMRALPFVLLLVGAPTRRRRVIALVAFVIWGLTTVASQAMVIYVSQYWKRQ